MKIWLNKENVRPVNKGWIHCTSVNEVITQFSYVKPEQVEELTFGVNLGKETHYGGDGTALLLWMVQNKFWPETVTVRANPSDFDKLAPVIRKYGNYPKKNGPNSWTRR